MSALLELRGVSKRYGGTQALRAVELTVHEGEVHALVGENGAGKSTLVRLATGSVRADSGDIFVDGVRRGFAGPLEAHRLGIRAIHQHTSLVPSLPVTENILLGQLPAIGRWWIDWRAAHRRVAAIFDEIGFERVPGATRIERLSYAQRKRVEIAKALAVRPRLLIMDEPSAALSHDERVRLFGLVRRLRTAGTAILYISHDLDEILALADRVTVLRDGAVVGTVSGAATNKRELIAMMVGREIEQIYPSRAAVCGEEVLGVHRLGAARFRDVSLSVARGEIVGLYGLVGSGRTELARCIFGADRPEAGEIRLRGRPLRLRSPGEALRAGIAMLTEDRGRDGLIHFLPVRHNVALANFARMSRWGIISRRKERSLVAAKIAELDVRPRDIERPVQTLSGGNQQKVVLARWLLAQAQVLILDEPTAGVDVGAKQEIYRVIGDLADAGMAILMISSDLPEVLGMSDRVLVMRKGQLVGEFPRGRATEQRLLSCATGADA